MLTNDKHLDIIILNNVNFNDLKNVPSVNKYFNYLINTDILWTNRALKYFPSIDIETHLKYKKDASWKNYYIEKLGLLETFLFVPGNDLGTQLIETFLKNGYLPGIDILHEHGTLTSVRFITTLYYEHTYHLDVIKHLTKNKEKYLSFNRDEKFLNMFIDYLFNVAVNQERYDVALHLLDCGADINILDDNQKKIINSIRDKK